MDHSRPPPIGFELQGADQGMNQLCTTLKQLYIYNYKQTVS